MSFLEELPRPFFVLAPMDDVTDVVFRQIVAQCARPDFSFTNSVNEKSGLAHWATIWRKTTSFTSSIGANPKNGLGNSSKKLIYSILTAMISRGLSQSGHCHYRNGISYPVAL